MTMIKAIVFDAGGVLLEWDYIDFLNKAYSALKIKRVATLETKPDFPKDLNRGKISMDEAMPLIVGEKINSEQIRAAKKIWSSYLVPRSEMSELVRKLKRFYKIALLSNSDEYTMGPLVRKGVFRDFDVVLFSHEHGTVKPEQRIYDILMRKLGVSPHGCVFIDDHEENIVPALEMGMKTIHFRSVGQCKEELRKLGVRF